MENEITYDQFQLLDLRIAEVKEAVAVSKTDKLVHLKLDIGREELSDVVAGIREHYTPEELVGKKVLYLANLKSRKLRGIISTGMVLAAAAFSDSEINLNPESLGLMVVDKDMPNGTKVG